MEKKKPRLCDAQAMRDETHARESISTDLSVSCYEKDSQTKKNVSSESLENVVTLKEDVGAVSAEAAKMTSSMKQELSLFKQGKTPNASCLDEPAIRDLGKAQEKNTSENVSKHSVVESSSAMNLDVNIAKDCENSQEQKTSENVFSMKQSVIESSSAINLVTTVAKDREDIKGEQRALKEESKKYSIEQEILNAAIEPENSQVLNQQKEDIRRRVENIAKTTASTAKAYIYGSTKNGFGLATSDLDITVLVDTTTHHTFDGMYSQPNELYLLHEAILANKDLYTNVSMVSNARVPIVSFVDKQTGISCDVNFGNNDGIYNTVLLKAYAAFDPRVRPLVLAIKKWAKSADILGAKDRKLASFVLYLMVIHYLQAEPKILPSIQNMCPDFFNKDGKDLAEFLDKPLPYSITSIGWGMPYRSRNIKLFELFKGFIYYYHTFSWSVTGISIRRGKRIYRPRKRKLMRTCLYVEDPSCDPSCELENAARSVFDSCIWKEIENKLKKAAEILCQGKTYEDLLAEMDSGAADKVGL